MASRVGGNYAELMRSSSCGPRIIYSESASLSSCITRSGFSAAAHVCLVSVKNSRDTPQREINFPILLKCLRRLEISLLPGNRNGMTIQSRSESNTRGLLYNIDQIFCRELIETNVSKSSMIKNFEKKHES